MVNLNILLYTPTNGLHFFTDDKNNQEIKMK